MAVDHNNPQSRNEEILIAAIDGKEYNKLPQSRIEELLLELKEVIEAGGGGGTTNYNLLSNRPTVNNILLEGNKTAADLSLVLAEVGKGLSTNDYSNEEKAKVASLLTSIQSILDGTDIDSFGDVEIALLDKADISDLGTAAAKDSTNAVTSGSTDLVESGAVKDAIDAAVSSAYHHAGTKTVAQLTHDLLVAANEGNVYNITDSGTTTSDFIEGIGKTIDEGSNVGICKVGNVYMFDLLSGFVDTTNFVQKSQTAGLLKNDGTVNTTIENDVDSLESDLTTLDSEVNGDATTYPYADVITIPDAIPANVADCSVKIEPVQSGSGDPSPTNIRPITGHTEVSVQVVDDAESPTVTKTYTIALGDTIYGGTVDFDSGVMTVTHGYAEFDGSSDEYWKDNTPSTYIDDSHLYTINGWTANNNAKAETGITNQYLRTMHLAEAPNTFRIVTGFNVRTYINSLEDWKTYLASNQLQLCYELATPITIQLTPQQIQLLKGQNTLTASTGDISVTVNGMSGAIGQVQEQVNELAEDVTDIVKQLPDAPTTDGVYTLTVTVADGVPTYSWGSAE